MNKISEKILSSSVSVYGGLFSLANKMESKSSARSGMAKAQVGSGLIVGSLFMGSGVAAAAGCSNAETKKIVDLIDTSASFVAALIAAASVLMLLWAAFLFITSAGSSNRAYKAKDSAKNVIIGFGLAAGIYIIRGAILSIVGGVSGGGSGSGLKNCLNAPGKIG